MEVTRPLLLGVKWPVNQNILTTSVFVNITRERWELSCRAVYHVRVLYVSRILGYLSFPTIWQMRLTQAHTILNYFIADHYSKFNMKDSCSSSQKISDKSLRAQPLENWKYILCLPAIKSYSIMKQQLPFLSHKTCSKNRNYILAEMTLLKLRNTTFLSNPFLYHPHLHSAFVDLYVKGRSDI